MSLFDSEAKINFSCRNGIISRRSTLTKRLSFRLREATGEGIRGPDRCTKTTTKWDATNVRGSVSKNVTPQRGGTFLRTCGGGE